MSASNFSTKNETFRKLLGNGLTYRVPRFQRDYSWDDEQWEDLWQDILGIMIDGGEPAHYMGYLVLQSDDDKIFDIIDGQQRITTLSIIVLAALRVLNKIIQDGVDLENTKKRLEGLRQTYIGYLDPVTLIPKSKLTLNRNNDNYYQTYIVPLADKLPLRGFKASEHGLRKAVTWFEDHIKDYVKKMPDHGMTIAQLIDKMSDKLFFTVITVTDELNAYKVFETLNARGVRLSATDLLKNYLFSVLYKQNKHEDALKALDNRWERIVGRLGSESFPDFLRIHWMSRWSFVRQAELFKVIRGKITTDQHVFELLTNMDADIDTYLALTSPEESEWSKQSKNYASKLKMFSVKQPYPLLIAAKRVLGVADYEDLLRAILVISFRYNVISNLQSNEQERSYHSETERISSGSHVKLLEILNGLRSIYVNDDAFIESFSDKSIAAIQPRNRRVISYILGELEKQEYHNILDVEHASITIEHILPRNSENGWDEFRDNEIDNFVDRLGNLTLLDKSANSKIGNSSFAEKKNIFAKSAIQMTKQIASDNNDWTPERLNNRQMKMAKLASSIWRINQLS